MLKLCKVTSKNFKSCTEFTLEEFSNLVVLIGNNGVGKSNILSIFAFIAYLRTILSKENPKCLNSDNFGYLNFIYPKQSAEFSFVFEVVETKKLYIYKILVNILEDSGHFSVVEELKEEGDNCDVKNGKLCAFDKYPEVSSMISEFFADICVYARTNNEHILFRSSCMSSKITEDCLARLLSDLKIADRSAYQALVELLEVYLPFFGKLNLEYKNNNPIISFVYDNKVQSFKELSSGARSFVILFFLLSLPENTRPHLLLIDEIEMSLHPHALEVIACLVSDYAHTSQIIVTTNSPLLVDTIDISNLYVIGFEKVNGVYSTKVEYFNKEALKRAMQSGYKLSELWLMNTFGGTPFGK